MSADIVRLENVAKTFTLHLRGGIEIPVFGGLNMAVQAGECVALTGASGSGKSTLMRLIYANYRACSGRVLIRHDGVPLDLVSAPAHEIMDVRARTLGYVSQFLRVIPRVPAIGVVAEPLIALGAEAKEATDRAAAMLTRLAIPEALWDLPPATFSGGERQRVNIARGFVHPYPVLLLDEPTASLDAANRGTVVDLVREAKRRGACILGIFHDGDVRGQIADRTFDVEAVRAAA
ncbi:MAG: phosphonate C-P lyase system protein PhnL [Pseudomonadota bacterium]